MSKVLDFLENQLPTIGGVAGGLITAPLEALDAVSGVGGTALNIAGATAGSDLGKMLQNKLQGRSTTSGLGGNTIGAAVGAGLGEGFNALFPGFSELGSAGNIGSKIAGKGVSGAVSGALIGGGASVAQGVGQKNGKSLTMDFLQGATQGAVSGAVTGAAFEGVNQAVQAGRPSQQLSSEDLNDIAQSDNPKEIANKIEPVTGPVVAQKIAPSVATDTDGATVKNQIDNSLNQHLSGGIPEPTPVSNVNTPQQVNQEAAAAPQSYEEALNAQAPPIEKPFLNAPGDEPQNTHVNELAAVSEMRDMINAGEPLQDAVQHYRNLTGADPMQSEKVLNDMLSSDKDLQKGMVNGNLNPQHGQATFPEAKLGDNERPILNAQAAQKSVGRLAETAITDMKQLSPKDLALVRSLKGHDPSEVLAQAADKNQFQKVIDDLKNYNDYTQAAGSGLGQNLPYRQNYGIRTPYEQPEIAPGEAGTSKLPTDTSYTKQRIYKTHEEALANGAVPKYDNAIQDLAADAFQRSHDQAQLALEKGFQEAYPGQIKIGQIGYQPGEGTYHQLLVPGGENISLPSDIADKINARQPYNETNPNWQKYDNLNAEAKNLKLGGGLFHGTTTLGTFTAQQLASGHGLSSVGEAISKGFSTDAYNQYQSDLQDSGHLRAFDQMGLTYKQPDVAADVEGKGKLSNIPVLKQMHDAVFGRMLPFMKMRSLEQWMTDNNVDPNNMTQEQIDEGTKISKTLNNAYGGQNRAIQGLTDKQYTVASRALLSTDYTTGQLASLRDAFLKGGPEGKLARQIVFGKALLFGGLATAGAAAGGEFKDQTPQQVAIDILHKFVNPSFTMGGYKVGLPATQISLLEKPLEQTISGAQNGHLLQGVQNFANSRLAAVPSEALQLAGNKDYLGQPIYGSDTHGRPISAGSSAEEIASTVLPIPAAQGLKTASGSQSPLAGLANLAGLNTTPQENNNNLPVAEQTYLDQLKQAGKDPQVIQDTNSLFNTLKKQTKSGTGVSEEINKDLAKGDVQSAQQAAQNYNQQFIAKLKPLIQKNPGILTQQVAQELESGLIQLDNSSIETRLKSILQNPQKYGIKTPALQSSV